MNQYEVALACSFAEEAAEDALEAARAMRGTTVTPQAVTTCTSALDAAASHLSAASRELAQLLKGDD